jgi:hypothetical protein
VNAEFHWWLLIVGLILGGALTWLVMSESVRRDSDIDEAEQRGEARWIATTLSDAGRDVELERVEEILRLHREYLAAPPPDDPIPEPSPVPPDHAERRDPLAPPTESRLE